MSEAILGKVKTIFLKVFDNLKQEDFNPAKKAEQYENWDSFTHMQLVSEIESAFNVTFSVEEIAEIDSAEKIVYFLTKK